MPGGFQEDRPIFLQIAEMLEDAQGEAGKKLEYQGRHQPVPGNGRIDGRVRKVIIVIPPS